ncbi:MAG: myo-inositol-1(or 4)-monophosphatase [Candidatus Tokpelaia sp. JSC161]|nr:MAG: myo-inositol-1(or 4)-monophosphatase [Candidatus Tokpelaia sp. JSC161]
MLVNSNNFTIEDDLLLLSWAAREAGREALRYFGQSQRVWLKDGHSPVSEADFAVNAFLKRELLGVRPEYGWVSEESDDYIGSSFRRFFVVDPIDGTRAFLKGDSDWCISISVIEDRRPLVGVIECPLKKEHFVAQIGRPAFLNGEVMRVVVSSHPFLVSCQQSIFNKLPLSFRTSVSLESRYIGSLAYRLALLSSGRLNAVFIRCGCYDWDIAASDIILQQSGGLLADAKGRSLIYKPNSDPNGFLFATANKCFKDILDVICTVNL